MQKAEDKLLANRTVFSFLTGVPKSLDYSTRFLMQSKVKLSMILAEDNMQERRRMGIQQSKAAKTVYFEQLFTDVVLKKARRPRLRNLV